MSREDPQFKLRMPRDLRNKVETAAAAAGRSLNAEIVTRVEASFLTESEPEQLISAERARELSKMARLNIPDEIRIRVIRAINRAVFLGHSSTSVDLRDLDLDGELKDEGLDELFGEITQELSDSGYASKWEGGSWIWIGF